MDLKRALIVIYKYVHHLLSRISIVLLLLAQIFIIDHILVYYTGSKKWWSLLVPDSIYLILFIIHMYSTYRILIVNKNNKAAQPKMRFPWGPLAWVIYSVVLSSKLIIIFTTFAPRMEPGNLSGPNALRGIVGQTAVIFFLLLVSHVHSKINPVLRGFIFGIGATVPLDLLDTMDIMELLYDAEEKELITNLMLNTILFIIVVNLLIPVFPLAILSIPDVCKKVMFIRLMITQKVIQIVVINVLFMAVRLILWQHFGKVFSSFIVKNILMVGILSYDIFGICKEAEENNKKEEEATPNVSFLKGEVYI